MDTLRNLLRASPPARPQTVSERVVGALTTPLDPRAFSPQNPHFIPLPCSKPIPVWAAILPPLSYYVALTLLPPLSRPRASSSSSAKAATGKWQALATSLRFALATISIVAFAVLPFVYHVPGSAILTYQLGLVGCYGACRVFDVFFLSYPRVPRRLRLDANKPATGRQYPSELPNEQWPTQDHPVGLKARLWWALDLLISSESAALLGADGPIKGADPSSTVRGVGWDYASPDVRHDTNPWQPPSRRQLQRAFFKIGPVLAVCLFGLRAMM